MASTVEKLKKDARGRGKNKKYWTTKEDDVLIDSLHELSLDPRWKGENGFRSGYMNRLEEMIRSKLPTCDKVADPHIQSRLKHWSDKYAAMAEMLGTSGFGWDDEEKKLKVDKDVFDDWVKIHKKAKGLYEMPFPHYDVLAEIYGKDRATGDFCEGFTQAVNNIDAEVAKEPTMVDIDDDDTASEASVTRSATQTSKKEKAASVDGPPSKKRKLQVASMGKSMESGNLVASFDSASSRFGDIFMGMSDHMATIAKAMSRTDEREQKLDDKGDTILDEVMKLEGISPTEALKASEALSKEEHKLRIFYRAPPALKKQYVLDILKDLQKQ